MSEPQKPPTEDKIKAPHEDSIVKKKKKKSQPENLSTEDELKTPHSTGPKKKKSKPQEGEPKTTEKKATLSRKWSFHYKPGFSEEDMHSELVTKLYPKGVICFDDHFQEAIINREKNHIYITMSLQVSKGLLKALPFIDESSIESWSYLKHDLSQLDKFPGYETWKIEKDFFRTEVHPEVCAFLTEYQQQKFIKDEPLQDEESRLRDSIDWKALDWKVLHDLKQGRPFNDIVLELFWQENSSQALRNLRALKSFYELFEKFCHDKSSWMAHLRHSQSEEMPFVKIESEDVPIVKKEEFEDTSIVKKEEYVP